VNVGKASYINPGDSTTMYTYNNKRDVYYAQLAYRPTMLKNKVLKNFEGVVRYGALNLPNGAQINKDETELIFGLNYWVTWRTVIKSAYKLDKDVPTFWLQVATGF
jgi:hypothetical protein